MSDAQPEEVRHSQVPITFPYTPKTIRVKVNEHGETIDVEGDAAHE